MGSLVPKKYDVFISFRGEDTRNTFTSHLHKALLDRNIETYIDGRLGRGDEISCSLLAAIEESKLSIIVFSENYASSSWCLDELAHIFRCKETNRQIVLPIFYHVSPSDVRRQQGSYAIAFGTLEERFKDDLDKVKQWRDALTKAANLSGWDAPVTRPESELVERIVRDVMEKLHCISSGDDLNGLVGIDKRIEHIESLLLEDLSLDVRIIGIWGMGGLGKTTLAHLVFHRLYRQFKGYCFLENVREEWQKHGKFDLRNRLFTNLLEERNPHVINMVFVKDRLRCKKILMVLDDIDDLEQFEHLVGGRDWLRPGSRIIVTTRNKQVLKNIEVDRIYMAEQLNEDEALQLFSLHAFRRNSPTESFLDLSRKVIDYAAGLPLALKVLGSHLYSKSKIEWESALEKLKVVPNKKIQNILQISYDGLDDKEKDVFLDVARFFKGERRSFVEELLDDCGSFAEIVRVLVDKTLITLTYYDQLWMHDLVQEMGREIVRQECIKEPGMRSRLWIANEVCHILKNDAAIWFKMKEIEQEKIIFPRINLCCPGNEIPWWFSDQSKGSSIQIKLSPTWHNPDFFGFAFCFVVEFEHYCFDVKHLNYCCEYHLKTNHGESYKHVWRFQRPEKAEWMKEIKFLNSDHMFMGLLCEDCYDFRDVVEMSFEFCLEPFDWEALVENGKYKVKECGIRTLYLQDAEEFGVSFVDIAGNHIVKRATCSVHLFCGIDGSSGTDRNSILNKLKHAEFKITRILS